MKRYMLFAGDTYYPAGGWDDFVLWFDEPEELAAYLKLYKPDWWQVVDTKTWKRIDERG